MFDKLSHVSAVGFFGGTTILGCLNIPHLSFSYIVLPFFVIFSCLLLRFFSRDECVPHTRERRYGVVVRAWGLGVCFGLGVMLLIMYGFSSCAFPYYMCVLSFFHFSEYFMTAVYNPKTVTLESYMLSHSTAYHIAWLASVLEFAVELYLFPGMKNITVLVFTGLAITMAGELIRKLAMITAKSNFNHHVQYYKKDDHVLVTGGVYSWSRHPSYVGWFWWSVGTQILLANPVCAVGYACASWKFLHERIKDEERTLIQFFGLPYIRYMRQVPTRLPFSRGLESELASPDPGEI